MISDDLWILFLARIPTNIRWTRQVCLNCSEERLAKTSWQACNVSNKMKSGKCTLWGLTLKMAHPISEDFKIMKVKFLQRKGGDQYYQKPPETLNGAPKYSHDLNSVIHVRAKMRSFKDLGDGSCPRDGETSSV